jgi:ribosome recycling factor
VINDIKKEADERMKKCIESLDVAFKKIRTGRANPSLLDSVRVNYYGSDMPINQVAQVTVEDARTLSISPWEKQMVTEIEKAILKSDLGLNPNTAGSVIRLVMPALTEETRKDMIKVARGEAEHARVAVRNVRRDANNHLKELLKEKQVSEDEERKAQEDVQKLTDKFVAEVDANLKKKEQELLSI